MSTRKRPPWMAVVEGTAIASFAVLLASLAARVAKALREPEDWALLAAAAPVGLLLADFFSGFVHWFFDSFLREESALGRMLVAPFREHHRDPDAMTRHGFLELNGNNCLVMTLPLALADWRFEALPLFAASAILFLGLAIFATNQIHCWAHAAETPRLVRWMQRRRLLLSPEAHADHHRPAATGCYCVTLGWLNPMLDRMHFFRGCELVLGALGLPRAASSP